MNTNRFATGVALVTACLGAGPVGAREKPDAAVTPVSITALTNCRKETDSAQRLSCYDRAVAALDTAISANDIYVVDKASVRKTRATLFGLQLPNLGLFDKDSTDKNEVSQLEGVVAAASQDGYGNWRLTLEDGAVWLQTDELQLGTAIKVGDKAVIKRASLGSYKMVVGRRPAFRAKRLS